MNKKFPNMNNNGGNRNPQNDYFKRKPKYEDYDDPGKLVNEQL
jgi:hypothetical protein